ncbi:hypothetical protein ARMSODRAFT_970050 [Armillaria solidipes]|uniref:Zn(2)-C6 fungal-type domain-containing protein n=1 Tax=Armillaria solidipes TaxID=1076256 RepID=A0A2H3C0J4_9AGAR|nr:hypothetical protein ARMSODRAFT_970050 [Armillaria solidipes]
MATVEERYDEAAVKVKEAWTEVLRLKEVAHAAKLEALRQQELEKEQLWLEAEEKQWLRLEAEEKQERERQDEENENLLVAADIPSGEDGDSESDPMDLKTVAMAELRKRQRIAEGKKKAGSVEIQKCKVRSASVVESGEEGGNVSAGLSVPKHLKMEPEPTPQDKVFTGSGHCGKCRANKAICFICSRVRTCQWCHVKKARCTFNKGGEDSGAMESSSILELLQDISSRLTCLEEKIDAITGHVEDLVDDYDVDNEVKYPEDFIPKSIKAEFEVLQMELQKPVIFTHQLDRDMALIKAEGLMNLSLELLLGMDDLYEILNKLFWIETVGATGLHEKMLACNKFLQAHQDFYNLWKRLLKDQEDMIPGVKSVGIPDLDAMIKMLMPMVDPEEEAEKEHHQQAMVKMRAQKCEKGDEVESEVEMYEDLEQILVQEEVEKDVEMAGPSSTNAA